MVVPSKSSKNNSGRRESIRPRMSIRHQTRDKPQRGQEVHEEEDGAKGGHRHYQQPRQNRNLDQPTHQNEQHRLQPPGPEQRCRSWRKGITSNSISPPSRGWQWPRAEWAVYLVPYLTGRDRSAYVAMDIQEAMDFSKTHLFNCGIGEEGLFISFEQLKNDFSIPQLDFFRYLQHYISSKGMPKAGLRADARGEEKGRKKRADVRGEEKGRKKRADVRGQEKKRIGLWLFFETVKDCK
ncbi:hypothetical protein JOB18_038528 [Solea senegalensis]|uniref:Uncharacterized protein n=1 Tax=Solea senegalensis TaxID=28829 RepID=A0AAV6Q819_SOLSE|nr:hypothetical protein JOB18_038528 [Solea senegalensis]